MTEDAGGPRAGGRPAGLPERVVLVGFMGAGKTTVGRIVARRLGYDFVDLDEEVERCAGRTIPDIFRTDGEEGFRALEARVTADLAPRRSAVIAAGGGWMARPELRDRWPGAVRVWLQVGPTTALRRLGPAAGTRPLLAGGGALAAARSLLRRRAADYGRAEIRVETEGRTPEAVAGAIVRRLRGWNPPPGPPVDA